MQHPHTAEMGVSTVNSDDGETDKGPGSFLKLMFWALVRFTRVESLCVNHFLKELPCQGLNFSMKFGATWAFKPYQSQSDFLNLKKIDQFAVC